MRRLAEREHLLPGALLVVVVAAAVVGYFVLPRLLVAEDIEPAAERLQLRKDVRTSALALAGGLAVVVGTYFTARTFHSNRQGQLTERFTRAVQQLDSERIEVRLGGLYGLERIARESRRDHPRIMELVTAFVRAQAPWPPPAERPKASPRLILPPARDRQAGTAWEPPAFAPPDDVQAALDVLVNRNARYDDSSRVYDLQAVDLRGASLFRANLERVSLRGAHLDGAMLARAHGRAMLTGASLTNANLVVARLRRSELIGADLRGALLVAADLRDARLMGAKLAGAGLIGAKLGGANLDRATEANFTGALTDRHTVLPG